jgi:hypothetical protein
MAEAISLRESLPLAKILSGDLEPRVSRLLPGRVIQELRVLPFRLEEGTLHVAAAGTPDGKLQDDLRRFTALAIRFHVITPSEFAALAEAVMDPP